MINQGAVGYKYDGGNLIIMYQKRPVLGFKAHNRVQAMKAVAKNQKWFIKQLEALVVDPTISIANPFIEEEFATILFGKNKQDLN